DHKFDPIPQRDYYRLQAVFAGVDRGDRPYTRELDRAHRALETQRAAVVDRLHTINQPTAARTGIDPALRADRETARRDPAALDARIKALPSGAWVYAVRPHAPRPIFLLHRGDVEQPGEVVGPGALSCMPDLESVFALSDPDDEGARRAALAGWIADRRNRL